MAPRTPLLSLRVWQLGSVATSVCAPHPRKRKLRKRRVKVTETQRQETKQQRSRDEEEILQLQQQRRSDQQTSTAEGANFGGAMGRKDGGWRDADELRMDVRADRSSGGLSQRPPCTPPGSAASPDDHPPQRGSASQGDGVTRSARGKSCEDDDEGHLVYAAGLVMKDRYEVVFTLGAGAFGKVVECMDREKDERVAVKIVRSIECFREVARSEIAVLEEISNLDEDNRFACVRMLDWFEHQGHICIVFELLGLSTFDFLRQNDFSPFNVEQIRHMAFQIFRAVCFLHRNKLTHTDLKPENILFISSDCDLEYNPKKKREEKKLRSLDVKVVDFGTATFDHEHHESLVSTRHYRAPEVILDLGWNQSCDVWSLACVLLEFYLGRTLFPTHDSREHLAMMEKVLGPIPPHLLQQTRKQHYVHNDRLNWDEQSSSDDYISKHCKPLKCMWRRSEEERQLFDLLGCMLEFDVGKRITLEEALWHPFFSPMRPQTQQRS